VDLGYARVSTVKQDLDRQIDALEHARHAGGCRGDEPGPSV
jgi:DNA invertase Pin-like site-specific DNA recombinase